MPKCCQEKDRPCYQPPDNEVAYLKGPHTLRSHGTALAVGLKPTEKEREMSNIIQVFMGLVVGCVGFLRIAEHPIQGCSALLLSGFLILAGLDHSHDVNR